MGQTTVEPKASSFVLVAMCLAMAAPAFAQRVANPGPVVLTLDLLDVEYERTASSGPSAVGFRFDAAARTQCSDGRNNDDHRAVDQGIQDHLVDYPADPECVSPDDDSEDKAGMQPRDRVVLTGTVDEFGNLYFPAEGVRLPPQYYRSAQHALGGDGVVINTFVPAGPTVGHIDPVDGTMHLEMRLRLRLQVEDAGRLSGPGSQCYIGSEAHPQRLVLIADRREPVHGVHPRRPRGYYAEDGMFVLAGTNPEALPHASCCGLFCFGDSTVDAAFGMPAPPGAATLAAIGRVEPRLVAPEASKLKAALQRDDMQVFADSGTGDAHQVLVVSEKDHLRARR
jgi:hypothetical protein